MIVVTPIDDLRRDSVQISRGLSWELTAQDLSWEFNYNPRLKMLAGIHTLAVPVGSRVSGYQERKPPPDYEAFRKPHLRLYTTLRY